MSTPAERGDLAERLLPIAAGLACITHGDGDQRDITHTLSQLDQAERDALIVILAGLVNPDTRLTEALGYITWDETGRPATDRPPLTGTLRDIATIRQVTSGIEEILAAEHKYGARVLYYDRHFDQGDIAEQYGVTRTTVGRWIARRAAA